MPPTSAQIRQQFIDFFVERASHTFTPSSPVVPHDDPTLLFTNAGMNQFKPLFLGQVDPASPLANLTRAVNSQKCIRAGGKHNDLDDVGKDTYHHTFFEMLGNWSFGGAGGGYFKAEAIQWAWELLTDIWGLDPNRLYATYFEGNKSLGLDPDLEAYELWQKYLPASRILPGNMKDNFWEMGDTGPCGPCSEIHYDFRSDEERNAVRGDTLVNADSESVIEIWNLVFIQFNRIGPTDLEPLPARHVDTGMGFERITRVIQGKSSNYDTDVFTPIFDAISKATGARPYKGGPDSLDDPIDTAYRVVADHIRTLLFAITDGAEPSNDGRGYVLRRILRRAVRYGRQTLGADGPFLANIIPAVVDSMGDAFPELRTDHNAAAIITDEEESFGRTLGHGLQLFTKAALGAFKSTPIRLSSLPDGATSAEVRSSNTGDEAGITIVPKGDVGEFVGPSFLLRSPHSGEYIDEYFERRPMIDAEAAFQLHDTFGFPIDLTRIMAEEAGLTVDVDGFHRLMEEARQRSRGGAGSGGGDGQGSLLLTTKAVDSLKHLNVKPTDDAAKHDPKPKSLARVTAIWNGYDLDEHVLARNTRPTDRFAIILDKTTLYAEAGGQQADHARLEVVAESRTSVRDAGGGASGGGGSFIVEDVRNCAGYVVHIGRIVKGELRVGDRVEIRLDTNRRAQLESNHTATHLLNLALRNNLGDHIDQKGSLVAPDRLRFDFSHNAPLTQDEASSISALVREQIEADLQVHTKAVPLEPARKISTLRAVFGETYPDPVRVVSIGAPIEDLIANPTDPRFMSNSVEFCGGTHVRSTAAIDHFALVAEESVSKGVRRLVALTGHAAAQAIDRATQLAKRIDGAASLPDNHLAAETAAITEDLDQAEIPLETKAALRTKLETLRDRAKAAAKQASKAEAQSAVDAAKKIAAEASGPVIVAEIPAGADRQAILAAMDAIRAKHESAAVMLLSVDHEEAKIAIVAKVPDTLIKQGLKAGDWVRAASQACGGKGGGKPDSAQGGGTDPAKLNDAIEAARAFVTQSVG